LFPHSLPRYVRLASETDKAAATKAVLLDMAQCWVRLAEQAEKTSHLDLVYAPPAGPWLTAEE